MASFKERVFLPADIARFAAPGFRPVVVTNDVTIINWTGTDSTFTAVRQDIVDAGVTTGTVTFNGTDTVAAAAMQVAIRALGGIFADATVVAGVTADNMLITVYGGYNIVWTKTGGVGVITETGAAGSDTAVVGKVVYAKQLPIGKYAEVKKIVAKGFNDNALVVAITDADSKTVFSATIDTSTTQADAPFVRLLTADGVAGEDGAAAANTSSGVFRGPLSVSVTANAPAEKDAAALRGRLPRLSLVTLSGDPRGSRRILKRTSGARATLTGTIGLGVPLANIKRIRLKSSSDTTVVPTLTDADGLVIYTKSSSDFTTAVLEQVSHDGVDQANNAVADLLDVIAKSPLTISGSGLGAGTFQFDLFVEV